MHRTTVWSWTDANLATPGDGLFASLWSGGRVADSHDRASDADLGHCPGVAATRLGAGFWQCRRAPGTAIRLLGAMWQNDVVSINRMNVLTAGNWAKTQVSPGPVINPSYFAPYAYRTFAHRGPGASVDNAHRQFLHASRRVQLPRHSDGTPAVGLPPNWCAPRDQPARFTVRLPTIGERRTTTGTTRSVM